MTDVLPAEDLLDAVQMANLRSLGGYNPEVNPRVKEEMYQEARDPRHVAISLAGEPTLYPLLNDLIEVIEKRGMTSFLVTNGTRPDTIAEMNQPTQLYVTLAAPDEQTYKRLCRPVEKGGWEKLNQTQEVLQSLSGRRTNRLTMVAEENMHNPRAYANLILQGEPDFVEVKGYMHLGSSRGRMSRSNAPPHRDIRAFSEKIASLTGYFIQDEQIESRVVLLSRSKQIKKLH